MGLSQNTTSVHTLEYRPHPLNCPRHVHDLILNPAASCRPSQQRNRILVMNRRLPAFVCLLARSFAYVSDIIRALNTPHSRGIDLTQQDPPVLSKTLLRTNDAREGQ